MQSGAVSTTGRAQRTCSGRGSRIGCLADRHNLAIDRFGLATDCQHMVLHNHAIQLVDGLAVFDCHFDHGLGLVRNDELIKPDGGTVRVAATAAAAGANLFFAPLVASVLAIERPARDNNVARLDQRCQLALFEPKVRRRAVGFEHLAEARPEGQGSAGEQAGELGSMGWRSHRVPVYGCGRRAILSAVVCRRLREQHAGRRVLGRQAERSQVGEHRGERDKLPNRAKTRE